MPGQRRPAQRNAAHGPRTIAHKVFGFAEDGEGIAISCYGDGGASPAALEEFLQQYRTIAPAAESSLEEAVAEAQNGRPGEPNPWAAACVAVDRFVLRNNVGGGDCLFHALAGTAGHPSLTSQEIATCREETARVRESMPDGERARSENGHEVAFALDQAVGRGTGDARRPVSNAMYAALQRIAGVYAGESEIAQWLNIPGNPVRVVTVVDALPGSEALLILKKDERRRFPIASLGETKEAASQRLVLMLTSSIEAERAGIRGEHIALYRKAVHYQRIVGLAEAREPSPFAAAAANSFG